MKRIVAFVYGAVCYGVFLATFLYAIGFLGNFGVPKSIDSGPEGSTVGGAGDRRRAAGAVRAAAQHHGAALVQAGVDAIVPEPVERSTYVLFSSVALLLMFWQWRPIGGVIWSVEGGVGEAILSAPVCDGTGDRAAQHVPDQPLRPVRAAAGLSVPDGPPVHATWNFARRSSIATCGIRSMSAGC